MTTDTFFFFYACISLIIIVYLYTIQWTHSYHKYQSPKILNPLATSDWTMGLPRFGLWIWLRLRRCRLHPTGLEAFGTLEGWPHRWKGLVGRWKFTIIQWLCQRYGMIWDLDILWYIIRPSKILGRWFGSSWIPPAVWQVKVLWLATSGSIENIGPWLKLAQKRIL